MSTEDKQVLVKRTKYFRFYSRFIFVLKVMSSPGNMGGAKHDFYPSCLL